MNDFKLLIAFVLFVLLSCHTTESKIEEKQIPTEGASEKLEKKETFEISYEKLSDKAIPQGLSFEGKVKEVVRVEDLQGEHIILLTETGIVPSKKVVNADYEKEAKIFVYDYLYDKNENKYKLNWKVQDFILNCEFDLSMNFVKDTFKITDLNHNGIAEIWTMYSMLCTSDISPDVMKIIMYEGKQKYALRGHATLMAGEDKLEEGEYQFDENLSKAPKEIKDFALKMWRNNSIQKLN
ncbi:hypothetical protein D1J36_008785 [Riemerella anatipestifer]|uniref:M949_RS01915 family surface polysaccharide biosynthesis protein n=1 Tax=Riemerella anatipestifer TaxID=34085 RepID=UPI0012AD55D4|nr:hypothetical protein [Riemerella anatipestifer]USL95365.1 hypothetical protein D1J36_008785 [Riemerella anatipestifer]